jgi:hypothetical protein
MNPLSNRRRRAERRQPDFYLPSDIAFLSLPRACCLSRLLGGLSDERWFSGDSKLDGRERAEDEAKPCSTDTTQ